MPGPPTRGRRKKGTQNQAIGRPRGGSTTKIGALVDALGNRIAFASVPGERHDVDLVDKLINSGSPAARSRRQSSRRQQGARVPRA